MIIAIVDFTVCSSQAKEENEYYVKKKKKKSARPVLNFYFCYFCYWYVPTGKAFKGYWLPYWQGEPGEESNFWTKLVNERNGGKW